MKQNYLKSLCLMLMMIVGMGAWADDNLVYTLDATSDSNQGSNSGYTGNCDVTVDGIMWNATGNITMSPWRIGGKASDNKNPLTTDRNVYSKTAYNSALTKVTVEIGAASSVTINSIKLIHSTNANFSSATTLTSSSTSSSTTHEFAPVGGFPANSYFKVVFNVTISSTSNKFIEFKNIKFYSAAATKQLSSIAVKTAPTKVVYTEGETFTPAGLVITKTYDDATTEDLAYDTNSSYFSFSPSTSTKLQESDDHIQITVGGKSVNLPITVNPIPSHTAHFSVNGIINNGNDCTVKEGVNVTFPSPIADVNGKKFQGWVASPIVGTTAVKPSYVDIHNIKMSNTDVTYYAVFATEVTASSEDNSTLTTTAIKENLTTAALAYADAEKSYDDAKINWVVKGYASKDAQYIQIRQNEVLSYIKVEAPAAITNVSFDATNGSGASFTGTIYVTTEPTANPGTDANVKGSAHINAGNSGAISTITGSNSTLYIQSSGAVRLSNIAVTYGTPGEYSDYCTTVTTPATSTDITITPAGYATFYDEAHAVQLPSGVKGYVWAYETLQEVYDGDGAYSIIPAGEPVVLKAAPSTYTLDYTTTSEQSWKSVDANDLCGAATDMTAAEMSTANPGSNYFYALSLNAAGETSSVGFYWVKDGGAAFDITAGKAYLVLPQSAGVKGFNFADKETAINAVDTKKNAGNAIFDLSGRRVNNATKGIYINNGRKVVK